MFKNKIFGNVYRKPDSVKQRNAFAPNFIHSLDSSHMMLTGLHCNKNNITFVSVHDCFWTHPCTVNAMNKVSKLLSKVIYCTIHTFQCF